MKKWLFVLLLCLLLPMAAGAETIDAFGLEVDAGASVIDFDAAQIQVNDAQALSRIIEQMPNLTEVLMFDSVLEREDMEWLFDTYPDVFFGWTLRFAIHSVRTNATAFSTLHYSQIKNKLSSL